MAINGSGRDDVNQRRLDDPRDRPPHDPVHPPSKPLPNNSNLGGSPGLITSTGGLYGKDHALLIPFFDTRNKVSSFQIIDSDNFDTEEDAFYYFPSPDIAPGQSVSIAQIAIIYREIGLAKFTIGIIVYRKKTDTFVFKEAVITISNDISKKVFDIVNTPFPDNRLHTVYADLRIDGERPQIYIKRSADSGPLSIQSVTFSGHKDVMELM